MNEDAIKTCPHCGQDTAVPIVYGMPGPEMLDDAAAGKIMVAGCIVSDEDPLEACRECGSQWTSSDDHATTALTDRFSDYFRNWSIQLPPGTENAGSRGLIRKAGWTIRYRFDSDGVQPYLEFYAAHRMTDDRHVKIASDGGVEHLDAIQGMIFYDPKKPGSEYEARERNRVRNEAVVADLETKGLYPSGDINAFLRTGGGEAMDALKELETLLAKAELPMPAFPSRLRYKLRKIAPWCYSTGEVDPIEMYLFVDRLRHALHTPPSDYAAFSHAGHGFNSYALNYELVHRNLILFAQAPWGGVYGDENEQRHEASQLIDQCNLLLSFVEEHGLDRPIVVAHSALRGIAICHWLDDDSAERSDLSTTGEDPFTTARRLILGQKD